MIAAHAVWWFLLLGIVLFLAMRTPGVLAYDFVARRLRRQPPGQPPRSALARKAPAAQAPDQVRQPG